MSEPSSLRVLVCGGRDFTDRHFLTRTLDALAKNHVIDAIIEGNQRGADRMAGFWARLHGIPNLKFNAEWKRYGNAAGPIRNRAMLQEGKPDLVIAFPGHEGTVNMVKQAKAAGIEVIEMSEEERTTDE